MKGHVPTPSGIVDLMVAKLFNRRAPRHDDLVIDPGCGTGPFIEGILRYCAARDLKPPQILGIDLDPKHLDAARAKFSGKRNIKLERRDYLACDLGPADFVIGNPPYVPITSLDEGEKARYRARYAAAAGRFDLYLLFFEQSLRNLRPGGRLCFITPEKFEYVASAAPLRKLLTATTIRELHHVDEETFPGLVTYPTITTLVKRARRDARTRVIDRDGHERDVELPTDDTSWNGRLNGAQAFPDHVPLEELCVRISCGVATGADDIFVMPEKEVPRGLKRFSHPTISGRQIALMNGKLTAREVMLAPYDRDGTLLSEDKLADLGTYLSRPDNKRALMARTCVSAGKKDWYAFHDNVPLRDLQQPKILCKDIAPEPQFWFDEAGDIVPRHSLYYLVPHDGVDAMRLLDYLRSEPARGWLAAHCQRAANGFLRLQSSVLRQLPVPRDLLPKRPASKQRQLAIAS